MSGIDLILAVGLFGAFIQLFAFVLNILGKISYNSFSYISANAFGCVFTSYYALMTGSIPFLVLEVVWGAFAFYKLAGKFLKK
ncbi:hypothetical protein H0O01_04050 [Candidatus Micrarchaeota archaeon]|nr:hypothetical protein [Candidatus Micrarchaeota archaeon]